MAALEKGAIANPDEHRMVGHLLGCAPRTLAPDAGDRLKPSLSTVAAIQDVRRQGGTKGRSPDPPESSRELLVIGIGGSALGPQLVQRAALGRDQRPAATGCGVHFFDNTDPDGMDSRAEGDWPPASPGPWSW